MVLLYLVSALGLLLSGEIFLVNADTGNTVLTSVPSNTLPASDVVGADIPLDVLLRDIDYLVLGACSDFSVIEALGRQIGRYLKSLGVDFWVFGSFKVIADEKTVPFDRISKSPYLTAHTIASLSRGLQIAGVVPVFDFRKGYDIDVIQALISRRAIYPFVVNDTDVAKSIKEQGFFRPYFVDMGNIWLLSEGNASYLEYSWEDLAPFDLEGIRREILRKSIVLLKPETFEGKGKIFIRELPERIPSDGAVVIFAGDPWLVELAKAVLKRKEPATGRKNW